MLDSEQQGFDDDVQRAMRMFERAKVGDVPPVALLHPQHILLALDHTAQDEMSRRIVGSLRQRFDGALDVVDGIEGGHSNELAESVAAALDGHALPKTAGANYEQVLTAMQHSQCDLLVVPSPFQREPENVGSDSTGTLIDVLLSRTTVPLLIVRQAYELEPTPFTRVVLVLISENEAAAQAARWACGMVAPGGRLDLMLVVEKETVENVRAVMQSLDPEADISPDQLAEAMKRFHARLHRACQKTAAERRFRYHLDVRHEAERPLAELTGGQHHPLIVLALEQSDHMSQGHVHDRIRHSPHPLLVVPNRRMSKEASHGDTQSG